MSNRDPKFIALSQPIAPWNKDRSCKIAAIMTGLNNEIRSTELNHIPGDVGPQMGGEGLKKTQLELQKSNGIGRHLKGRF